MTTIAKFARLSLAAMMLIGVAACSTNVPADKLIASELATPTWDSPAN
ncbi:MAG TPA: hypothetical protein VM689_06945 [Aliidongia sp.]|nr:hypothetical protein [Aliidongia sp.]